MDLCTGSLVLGKCNPLVLTAESHVFFLPSFSFLFCSPLPFFFTFFVLLKRDRPPRSHEIFMFVSEKSQT